MYRLGDRSACRYSVTTVGHSTLQLVGVIPLTTPPGTPATGPRVSPAAARSRSTTTATTPTPAADRAPAAPAEAAVPAHRQQPARPAPARRTGRGR